MVNKPPEYPLGLEREIAYLYSEGEVPLSALSEKYGLGYKCLRAILIRQGVKIRGRGEYSKIGSDHPMAKLTKENLEQLKEDLKELHSHSELARKYGVSRERIRQLALKFGFPSGRERNKLIKKKKREQRAATIQEAKDLRKQAREDRYKYWSTLWQQGLSIKEMAKRLGLKHTSVGVRIVSLRQMHPDWFPLRQIKIRRSLRDDATDQSPA